MDTIQSRVNRRAGIVLLGGLALILALFVAATAPSLANAAKYCVSLSGDGGHVCARDGDGGGPYTHNYIDVCDADPDGHNTYARVGRTIGGVPYYFITGYDENGAQSGCTTYNMGKLTSYNPYYINGLDSEAIAVCVQTEGCSPFKFPNGTLTWNFEHYPWSYTFPKA
jgi:hypothetical protein